MGQRKDLIKRLEILGATEPKTFCWLENTDGNIANDYRYEADFCYECAEKLASDKEDVCCGDDMVEDGTRLCQECGAILSIYLTSDGVQSELDHFNCNPPKDTPNNRRHLIDMLEGDCSEQQVERAVALPRLEPSLCEQVKTLVEQYLQTFE